MVLGDSEEVISVKRLIWVAVVRHTYNRRDLIRGRCNVRALARGIGLIMLRFMSVVANPQKFEGGGNLFLK